MPNMYQYQSPEEGKPPILLPVQVGEITEELKQYDGSDPSKPILMAIKHNIYDVTQSRMIYEPEGPYALFAAKDASRALAMMSFEEKDLTSDISGLGPSELDCLQDWDSKFMSKYVKVGTVKVTDSSRSESAPVSCNHTPEKTIVDENDDAYAESDVKE